MYTIMISLSIFSALVGSSVSSFVGLWGLMELNMMTFVGLMILNFFKSNKGESFVYLIVQSTASASMMIFFLMLPIMGTKWWLFYLIFIIMLKLGAAPFHLWYFWILESLTWDLFFFLSTTQKLLPLILLSLNFSKISFIFVILSLLFGLVGGLSSSNLFLLLGYSSLVNLSWMISLSGSFSLMFLFFVIYTINLMVLSYNSFITLKQTYLSFHLTASPPSYLLNFLISLLSLIGMPPTLGFLAKFYSIIHLGSWHSWLPFILLLSTGVLMWAYLRLLFFGLSQMSGGMTIKGFNAPMPLYLLLLSPFILLFLLSGVYALKDLTF